MGHVKLSSQRQKQKLNYVQMITTLITKMKSETEKGQVKGCMIKWAKNFGHSILMEQWENITRIEIYINLKVNLG